MSSIDLYVDSAGVATVTIGSAEQTLQPITAQQRAQLANVIEQIAQDPSIKGAVLRVTSKAAVFPPAELMELSERRATAVVARDFAREWQRSLRRLETCGKPIAAVLTGSILGGSLDLALACHYRVIQDDTDTVLGYPHARIGLLPWGGGTQRLPRLIGVKQALPLLLKGTVLTPAEALKLGVVHAVASADDCGEVARNWILNDAQAAQPWDRKGFRVPGGAGPLAEFANEQFMIGAAQLRKQAKEMQPALLAIMSAVYEGTICGFEAALAIESNYFGKVMSDVVTGDRMRAALAIAETHIANSGARAS